MTRTNSKRSRHILVVGDNSRMVDDFKCPPNVNFPMFVDCCVTSPPYRNLNRRTVTRVANILNKFLVGPLWLNFGDLANQMEEAALVEANHHLGQITRG